MALVKVEYVGPHDAVTIEWPVGAELVVERGVPVELPTRVAGRIPAGDDDPGEGLLAQVDAWRPVGATPKVTAAAEPAPAKEG